MVRIVVMLGAISGALAVALGAFGAHALADRVSSDRVATWETASRYHLAHSVALLAAAWIIDRWPGTWATVGAWSIAAGVAIFSGTLYLLVVLDRGWLGAITPVGGVLMIVGWLALAMAVRGG